MPFSVCTLDYKMFSRRNTDNVLTLCKLLRTCCVINTAEIYLALYTNFVNDFVSMRFILFLSLTFELFNPDNCVLFAFPQQKNSVHAHFMCVPLSGKAAGPSHLMEGFAWPIVAESLNDYVPQFRTVLE